MAEVALNYVELRAYQNRLAIAKANLDSQSETVQITQWRYQAGLASASDVEQAIANREQTRASIPDLEISQYAAENRLAVLAGRQPGACVTNCRLSGRRPPCLAASLPAFPLKSSVTARI